MRPGFSQRGRLDPMPRVKPERWARTGNRAAAMGTAVLYAVLAAVTTAITLALRDGLPWIHPEPWFPAPLAVSLSVSAALGLALATGAIAATRVTVTRFEWARRLHEELLFRGLLLPWIGVVPAAILFGLAHQMKGPSRWVWVGWATVIGLGLGSIFALTGSLVGPLLAHAVVNGVNLVYLRDHDPGPPLRPA